MDYNQSMLSWSWPSINRVVTYVNIFTVDNMSDQDSANIGIDTGNTRLDFDFKRDTTNDSSSWDLGATLDDTAWTMDYEVTYTTLSSGATNTVGWIGLSSVDSGTAYNGGAQDGIAWVTTWGSVEEHGVEDKDSAAFNTGRDDTYSGNPSTSTKYYRRTRRLTSTTYDDTFYSDSDRTTTALGGAVSGTCAATLVGLQYWKVGNFTSGSGDGVVVGYVENLKIYDAVTSP